MKNLLAIALVLSVSQTSAISLGIRPEKYDKDGDGVTDNVQKTREELDKFVYPNRMGDAGNDIRNTKHGNLPG